MKTVAQWAEQLPELIRIELLTQAKRQIKLDKNAIRLHYAIYFIDWVGLGYDFWEGVYYNSYDLENSADYLDESVPYTKEEVEAMILEYADPNDEVCKVMLANVGKARVVAPSANAKPIVLDELDFGEFLVEAPKEKKSSIYSKVIKTLKAENEALLQSNTEFKKRHKNLLKANQESMERRIELGTANSNLLSEIEKLKIWVEAEKDEIQKLYTVIYEQSDEIKERKADILHLQETIRLQEETIEILTQMAVPTPKKEQSIFFDLLEHLNIIKK